MRKACEGVDPPLTTASSRRRGKAALLGWRPLPPITSHGPICTVLPRRLGSWMAETPFPSPEELQKKIQEFMKTNFGDKVSVAAFPQPQVPEEEPPSRTETFDPFEF